MFEDAEFPPNSAWLLSESKGIDKEDWGQICWKRPQEFLKKYDLFNQNYPSDILQARDMKQGVLSDCYLVSALFSVAQNPQAIKCLFVSSTAATLGQYKVKLFLQGKWQIFDVDDRFPISKKTSKPLFLQHDGQLIWPLLIEKAWAKSHGGYGRLQMGSMREALIGLTGSPCDSMSLDRLDSLNIWEIITDGFQRRYSLTCGSKRNQSIPTKEQLLVQSNHAFSLIGCLNAGPNKAFRLWDPWGIQSRKEGNQGQLRQEGTNLDENGYNLMSFEQFLENFNSLSVCMTGKSNHRSELEYEQRNNEMVFYKLKIRQISHLFISASYVKIASGTNSSFSSVPQNKSATPSCLNQNSQDIQPNNDSCPQPITQSLRQQVKQEQLTAVLAKWQPRKKEYLFVKAVQTKENEAILSSVCSKQPLSPGKYVLAFKAQWPMQSKTNTALVTCYGQSPVKISVIPPVSHFLRSVALSIARQNWRHISPHHWVSIGQIGEGYFYIAAANAQKPSKEEKLQIQNINNSDNLTNNSNMFLCRFHVRNGKEFKIKKPFFPNSVNFQLKSGECDVAIIRCKNPQSASSLNISQHFQF